LLAVLALAAAGCGQTVGLVAPSSSTCAAVPPLRTAHVAFYDRDARRVVMYGDDLWVWDGGCWARVQARGDAPGDRAAAGLTTYDPDGKRVLLFGGTPNDLRQVWSWADGQWTRLADSPASPSIIGGAIAYDVARHQLVVAVMPPAFRGGLDDPRVFSMDTWLWDGGTPWRRADPAHKLPFRPESMVFDPSTNTVLASRLIGATTEVWSWDGRDWTLALAQIPTYRGVLVDGGDLGILAVEEGNPLARPGEVRRVFRFQAGRWVSVGPSTVGPSTVFAPTYDPRRKELVAFGDVFMLSSSQQVFTQDTWTWTPAAGWTKHAGPVPTPSSSPSPSESSTASAAASPMPSATPCVIAAPPAFAASAPSDRILALVTLTGSQQIVVRDITNLDSPATVASPGIPSYLGPSLVNASELAAINDHGVVRMPLGGTPPMQASYVCPPAAVVRYGWSRDGRYLTYVAEVEDATTPGRTTFNWHLVTNGSDHLIGMAPAWCHCDGETGQDISDFRVGFSTDGSSVFLVEDLVISANDVQIRRLDGTLVTEMKPVAPDSISMGVWSGGSLYFRDSRGVEAWTNGTVRPVLPGVAWIRPKANPAGGEITYFARGSDGLGHVYVVSTATGQISQLTTAPRTEPVFLTPRYIWYQGERLCTLADQCPFYKTTPTGVTYIYDRLTGTESVSRISAVYDVWPHGS
jgi:hypothetical protein